MDNKLVISSLIWKFLERTGTQIIQFVIQIILARLILPSEYGIIAILTIFISIATVFVESGFSTALLQKKNTDDLDYDTAFISSLVISIFVYILLYLVAPYISDFYQLPILTKVLRVSATIIIIGAYNSVQITRISKLLKFKKLFICSLISVVISGIIGIILAYLGFGVWSLVAQQVLQKIIICIVMIFSLSWKPNFRFSRKRFNSLFSFGSKLLISNLINTIYNNIYGLLIGRVYSSTTLGYYSRADQFPNIIVNNINGSLQSVMLPVFATEQDNLEKIKQMMRKTIKLSVFVVFPMMTGLVASAELIIRVFLTDKWLPSVPFLQILCFSYALYPIHTVNLQAINAMGRSDIFLKLEILKKIIGVLILCFSVPMGIMYMVLAQPLIGIISSIINASPNKKLLNYSFKEQISDVLVIFMNSFVMMIFILLFNMMVPIGIYLKLVLDILLGVSIYIILSMIFKVQEFNQLIDILKGVVKRGK